MPVIWVEPSSMDVSFPIQLVLQNRNRIFCINKLKIKEITGKIIAKDLRYVYITKCIIFY